MSVNHESFFVPQPSPCLVAIMSVVSLLLFIISQLFFVVVVVVVVVDEAELFFDIETRRTDLKPLFA